MWRRAAERLSATSRSQFELLMSPGQRSGPPSAVRSVEEYVHAVESDCLAVPDDFIDGHSTVHGPRDVTGQRPVSAAVLLALVHQKCGVAVVPKVSAVRQATPSDQGGPCDFAEGHPKWVSVSPSRARSGLSDTETPSVKPGTGFGGSSPLYSATPSCRVLGESGIRSRLASSRPVQSP